MWRTSVFPRCHMREGHMGHTMGHADEVYFVADSESLVSFFFFFGAKQVVTFEGRKGKTT